MRSSCLQAFRCEAPLPGSAQCPSHTPAGAATKDASERKSLKRRRLDGGSPAASRPPARQQLHGSGTPAAGGRSQQASHDAESPAGIGEAHDQKLQADGLRMASTVGVGGAASSGSAVGLAPEKMGDAPLRLVIVGHNPSHAAWQRGHFYAWVLARPHAGWPACRACCPTCPACPAACACLRSARQLVAPPLARPPRPPDGPQEP